jgi:hypothetical protein
VIARHTRIRHTRIRHTRIRHTRVSPSGHPWGMSNPTRYILRRRPLRRTPPKWPCQVLFRQNQVLFSKKRGIFVHSADGERNVLIRPFQRHILCRGYLEYAGNLRNPCFDPAIFGARRDPGQVASCRRIYDQL